MKNIKVTFIKIETQILSNIISNIPLLISHLYNLLQSITNEKKNINYMIMANGNVKSIELNSIVTNQERLQV